MAYASAAQLRQYLNQTTITTAPDSMLTPILDRASAMIRVVLRAALADPGFDFAAYGAAAPKIIQTYGTEYIALPPHEPASVTIVEFESGFNPIAYTVIPVAEWDEDADGRLYRPGEWGPARYRVTAKWGYGLAPLEIEQLTLELAVNIWRSKDKGSFTEMIGAEGRGAIRFIGGFTDQQKAILEAYVNQVRILAI